ncbi:hypothetical protein SLE2022_367560 [Rubroshorea leprosula]
MSNFPLDVIADILSRLSVKDLFCLRCVSKTFDSLIQSSDFVVLHLNRSINTRTNRVLILNNSDLNFVDLASFDSFATRLEHPLMDCQDGIKILGSCNGLLCVSNIIDDIAVWNPSTKEYLILPALSLGACQVFVYGFGYDSVNDDYKVVRIIQSFRVEDKVFELEVKVWSFGEKGWRRIEDLPYVLSFPGANGVFVCGALHWAVSRKDEPENVNTIVALDLGVEEYREVPQPEYPDGEEFHWEVGVLEGCLCVIADYVDSHVDLWVMREYGVKESWTKLLSLACGEVTDSFRSVKPLVYSRGGDQVLLVFDSVKLFWYDLEKKKATTVKARGVLFSYESDICLQSLVSLDVKKRNDARQQKEEDEKDDFLSVGFKLVL